MQNNSTDIHSTIFTNQGLRSSTHYMYFLFHLINTFYQTI